MIARWSRTEWRGWPAAQRAQFGFAREDATDPRETR